MESVGPICRVCLNVSNDYISFQIRFDSDDGLTIANDITHEINYLQCLRLCTNLSIEENDDGPQCLCAECGAELQVVYKFLQKAKSSQDILEESWKQNSSVEIIEHTEISIEKFEGAVVEDLDKQLNLSESNELSVDYNDFPIECESLKDLFEESDTIDDNDVGKEDDDDSSSQSMHEMEFLSEDNQTSENNTYIFIPKKYKCHICNRFYTTERRLKVHLSYHKRRNLGSKPYNCKICAESFSLQRYLTQHMIEHQGCRETHKCQYCDKEYFSKTALASHKRIHQGETLNCNECGKQFHGTYEFSVHQRFHRREKANAMNKCEICFKHYSTSRNLSQHMAVEHFGERKVRKRKNKPQHRDSKLECGKMFTNTKALNKHSYTHNEMPYTCKFCENAYPSKQKYKIHIEKMHCNEENEIGISENESLTTANSSLIKEEYDIEFQKN